MIKLNLNDKIKVKLTVAGAEELLKEHEDFWYDKADSAKKAEILGETKEFHSITDSKTLKTSNFSSFALINACPMFVKCMTFSFNFLPFCF